MSEQERERTKPDALSGVIDAALEIARKRKETLGHLRSALLEGETDEAIKLARELCGIEDDKTSHRTHSRIN